MEILNRNEIITNKNIAIVEINDNLLETFLENYSAFSNTKGGIIYIGISLVEDTIISLMQKKEDLEIIKARVVTALSDSTKVNYNLISNKDFKIVEYDGYYVLVITIYQASYDYKPIYINNNMCTGTFRRKNGQNYTCNKSEIESMIIDSNKKINDLKIIESLDLDSLDKNSINEYINLIIKNNSEIIYSNESYLSFLEYLGVIRMDKNNVYHPTMAGILMFGYANKIVYEFPEYYLSYKETNKNGEVTTISTNNFNWSGNIFKFYLNLLSSFKKYNKDLEILYVNCLCYLIVNSDFSHSGGITVSCGNDFIKFSNPGSMLNKLDELDDKTYLVVRNKTIKKMFDLLISNNYKCNDISELKEICKRYNYSYLIEDSYYPNRTNLIITFNNVKLDVVPANSEIDSRLTERERLILSYLSVHYNAKVKDIAKSLKLSISTIKSDLYKMCDYGIVIPKGTIKNKTYSINK